MSVQKGLVLCRRERSDLVLKSPVVDHHTELGWSDHSLDGLDVLLRNVFGGKYDNVVEDLVVIGVMQKTHGLYQQRPLVVAMDFGNNHNFIVSHECR